eukprot:9914099-Karenia_brevis.AAC.1
MDHAKASLPLKPPIKKVTKAARHKFAAQRQRARIAALEQQLQDKEATICALMDALGDQFSKADHASPTLLAPDALTLSATAGHSSTVLFNTGHAAPALFDASTTSTLSATA